MKNENGITLLMLSITIVIMAILLGVTVNYGTSSLHTIRLQEFVYELEQLQAKVNTIYEKIKLGDKSYITLGNNITDSKEAMNTLKQVTGIDYTYISDAEREEYYYENTFTKYRYFTGNEIEKELDISSNPGDVIINFTTREVISVNGFEFDGNMYYKLNDL